MPCSVTGNDHYQEPFKPLIGGIRFADFNDLDSVKAQVTDKTCAIILEDGSGGGRNLSWNTGISGRNPEALR